MVRPELKDTREQRTEVGIDRNEAFAMKLAERDMEDPLMRTDLTQTIKGKIDTLADTNAGGAHEQKRQCGQVGGLEELLLEETIVVEGKRPRQVVWQSREILAADEVGRNRMAVVGQIIEQASDTNQASTAGAVGQGGGRA